MPSPDPLPPSRCSPVHQQTAAKASLSFSVSTHFLLSWTAKGCADDASSACCSRMVTLLQHKLKLLQLAHLQTTNQTKNQTNLQTENQTNLQTNNQTSPQSSLTLCSITLTTNQVNLQSIQQIRKLTDN